MKKLFILAASVALLASCCGNSKCTCNCNCPACQNCVEKTATETDSVAVTYEVADGPNVDIAALPVDEEGYITLFNGQDLSGWRGYGMDVPPTSWDVEDGAIHLKGSGTGEAQAEGGGDLIFAHKFRNFTLELEYKVSKGGNSGIFYLAQEVKGADGAYLPIWQSASEFQVLDNENHVDATMGVDGNRQASSLYDMIPAKPQNSKPFGEWNKAIITVFKGTVTHGQNDAPVVLEYHLWTPKWTQMLQDSKFGPNGDYPIAYELLNNMGGENHEGYIGLQDHGDDVWYRNIRIKVLD